MGNKRVDISKCPVNNEDFAEVTAFDERTPQIVGGSIYLLIKRVFDLTASILAILLCLIPGILLAVLIKLESAGPVIYKQDRLGKNGVPFTIFKFRSMYQDAEEYGPQWAEIHDKRCTKIGRFIRRYHIDELPQFFNIVRGEMSLVGPRPEREFYYEKFDAYLPMFKERLLVKPGLTGLSQVNGCYDLLPEERLAYDLEYMRKRSLWLDLRCILKTVVVVFNGKGAR